MKVSLSASLLIVALLLSATPVSASESNDMNTNDPDYIEQYIPDFNATTYSSSEEFSVLNTNQLVGSFQVDEKFQYVETETTITLTKYLGTDPFLDIPATYNGKDVVIGQTIFSGDIFDPFEGPFASNKTLVAVIMEEGVTVENNNADHMFYFCSSLEVAPNLSDDVTSMRSTFDRCIKLSFCESLPKNVIDLSYCFSECKMLVDFPTIPNAVTSMKGTFYKCVSASNAIVIPDKVTDISSLYVGCVGITSAPSIPFSVTDAEEAFMGCSKLTGTINLSENIIQAKDIFKNTVLPIRVNCTVYSGAAGVVYPTNVTLNVSGTFPWTVVQEDGFLSATDYTGTNTIVNVPNTFRGQSFRVAPRCFTDNTLITEVNFLEGALAGNPTQPSMFSGCTSLVSVRNIPNNITTMYAGFKGCTSLVNAPTLPDSFTSMDNLFENCINLKYPGRLPKSITSLFFTYKNSGIITAPIIPETCHTVYQVYYGCKSLTGDVVLPKATTTVRDLFVGTEKPIDFYFSSSCTDAINMVVGSNIKKHQMP